MALNEASMVGALRVDQIEPVAVDGPGFATWYETTWPLLVGYLAAHMKGDAARASDVASEAMARAYADWHSIERPTAWVFAVSRNLVRRSAARSILEQRVFRLLHSSSEVAELAASDPDLMKAVASLPRRQRTAVLLRYAADLTQDQVAEVMRIAPGTAASLLHSARQRLRDQLIVRCSSTEECADV